MENKKEVFSSEEFREIAKEIYPHMITIMEIMQQHTSPEFQWSAEITIDTDGYINFRSFLRNVNWEITRFKEGDARISHEYHEAFFD